MVGIIYCYMGHKNEFNTLKREQSCLKKNLTKPRPSLCDISILAWSEWLVYIGRNPVSSTNQSDWWFSQSMENERADEGRNGWTRPARPNSQARTGTREIFLFPVQLTTSRIGKPYPVASYYPLLYVASIHKSYDIIHEHYSIIL